jgi:hypothetical protein
MLCIIKNTEEIKRKLTTKQKVSLSVFDVDVNEKKRELESTFFIEKGKRKDPQIERN